MTRPALGLLACALLVGACPARSGRRGAGGARGPAATLARDDSEDGLRLVVDAALHARVVERMAGRTRDLSAPTPLVEIVRRAGRALALELDASKTSISALGDDAPLGAGRRFELAARLACAGSNAACTARALLRVDFPRAFPRVVIVQLVLHNDGATPLALERVRLARVDVAASGEPWAFQGAALTWAKPYIFALRDGHRSDNFTGATKNKLGGGVPLDYVWRRGGGLGVAHVEPRAQALYLPLRRDGARARMHVEQRDVVVPARGAWHSVRAALLAGGGDFYSVAATYRALLARQGLAMPRYPAAAYEPIWCSWGYQSDVTRAEMTAILPKIKALGFGWSVIDDRWFVGYGNWQPRRATFGKDPLAGIKALVAATHRAGLRAKLWWMPLLVERSGKKIDGRAYKTAPVLAAHPEWVIHRRDGSPAKAVRELDILCPALPAVRAHTRALVRRFIGEWGFDGHKLDVIYAVPPCFNKAHHHRDPYESSRAMADVYRVIYEETLAQKPQSVTEICPCGTTPHFIWLPYMNQAVTADPDGARQVRHRVKLLKALMGARGAVFADHVELTRIRDNHHVGADFAAAVGTGAVVGSKLVWPRPRRALPNVDDVLLTPARERVFARWLRIYRARGLASGTARGELYDVAHDRPETHAIEKRGVMHYAFYSEAEDGDFAGRVELRGLSAGSYRVRDYVAGRDVATVQSDGKRAPTITVRFRGALLVEAIRR
ncbi:MAG: alpha-galactosidase [Myxococcales bacterium]|nr:alpha-galactosidase [Myxococcales bacterium]